MHLVAAGHGRGDDLDAGVGREVGALALLAVVVPDVVRVLQGQGQGQR